MTQRRVYRALLVGMVLGMPAILLAVLISCRWGVVLDADRRLDLWATDITRAHPGFRRALLVWQVAFHPLSVYVAATPVIGVVWRRCSQARAVWGVVTMFLGWTLAWIVKNIVARARPVVVDPVAHSPGYSFPSGHAFNTTLMLTVCLLLLWPLVRSRRARCVLMANAAMLVAATGLDRIFLGVHFPSDVAAGVFLALAVAFGSFIGFRPLGHDEDRHGMPQAAAAG